MADIRQQDSVTVDPWDALRRTTAARIALGRAGGSLPTREWLDFKAAHAAARDAVHFEFDAEALAGQLRMLSHDVIVVETAAADRRTYLERPDLGRQLSDRSRAAIQAHRPATPSDLAVIVSDGLSAIAAQRHAAPLLEELVPRLRDGTGSWSLAPIVVARFGRVALQDEIGELLGAEMALILLGERPGLGTPDSLGAYLVHHPRVGNTDANRNCVSNIRPDGLPYLAAANTLAYLLCQARNRKISGVQLKDERVLPHHTSELGQPRAISWNDH